MLEVESSVGQNSAVRIETTEGTGAAFDLMVTGSNAGWPSALYGFSIMDVNHPGDGPRFQITPDGNVGIGTTSPGARLDVASPASGVTINVGRVGGQPSIKSTADWLIMDSNTDPTSINHFTSQNVILAYGGGNVGIGTMTSPNEKLEVSGNILLQRGNAIKFGIAGTGEWITQTESTPYGIQFFAGSSERMRVANTGNVGIGTMTPAGKLTIGNNVATGFLNNYDEYQMILFDANSAAASYGLGIIGNTIVFNSGAGAYSFDRAGTATSMYLSTAGNVGIGTTAPGAKLEIAASGNNNPANNGLYVLNPNNSDDDDDAILAVRVGGTSAGDPFISWDVFGESGWSMGIDNSDANKLKIASIWNDPATETKLTIDRNGSVGIGTTAPGKKFQVNDGDGYMTYGDSSGVQVYNPEASSGEVRLGAAWNKPGVYSSGNLYLGSEGSIVINDNNGEQWYFDGDNLYGAGASTIRLYGSEVYDVGTDLHLNPGGGTTYNDGNLTVSNNLTVSGLADIALTSYPGGTPSLDNRDVAYVYYGGECGVENHGKIRVGVWDDQVKPLLCWCGCQHGLCSYAYWRCITW